MFRLALLAAPLLAAAVEYPSEIKYFGELKEDFVLKTPAEYVDGDDLPKAFDWGNQDGVSYLTRNLNQHIPQYCGSCWAHGALSALADRIKMARGPKAAGPEINLSIQFILNCAADVAGSCHGGSPSQTYSFIKSTGYVPYDTCLQYEACSSDSDEGFCRYTDNTCKPINICRTCSTFKENGGFCSELDHFPNATIAEHGNVRGEANIMKEVYARGPVACEVNASPLHDYEGGIFDDASNKDGSNHIVSITGWGHDDATDTPYWLVRNSWGEYWGENGFFRIKRGENQLKIEQLCAWATPGTWTETNYPCHEDGANCASSIPEGRYVDPALKLQL